MKKKSLFISEVESFSPEEQLKVTNFIPGKKTSATAVAFSGGGSRALTAGMGQLRTLCAFKDPKDGRPLLEKTRLISAVSGGAWLSVPFTYLKKEVSDEAFLNRYVADPEQLTLKKETDSQDLASVLSYLPEGNIGNVISHRDFGPGMLALEALALKHDKKVPTYRIWQTLVGEHILKPYGLYDLKEDGDPSHIFSYDAATFKKWKILNPEFTSAHFVCEQDSDHLTRPFLVCNMSFFVENQDSLPTLAPSQATPFFISTPPSLDVRDINGLLVGGERLSPFAWSSHPDSPTKEENSMHVNQQRLSSLMDITGVSSAFFSSLIEENIEKFRGNKEHFNHLIKEHQQKLSVHLPGPLGSIHNQMCSALEDWQANKDKSTSRHSTLVPEYCYWSTRPIPFDASLKRSFYADGGNLENTGIAAALSYEDIDNVVAFVNAPSGLKKGEDPILGEHDEPLTESSWIIDNQVPPLFGYQPYKKGVGYRLYANDSNPSSPEFRFNQLFPSNSFIQLLDQFGQKEESGEPLTFLQSLMLQDNFWFRVKGGREVRILWNYLNKSAQWYKKLQPSVQDYVDKLPYFPNYPTAETHLSAKKVNLLAHYTSWVLSSCKDSLLSLYEIQ